MRIIENGSFLPLWKENLRRDADKLSVELSRRTLMTASIAALALEYVGLRRAYARPLFGHHGGVTSSISAITNATTSTTYQYISDAVYAASTGDTILIPAGLSAPAFTSTPYSQWRQLFHTGGPNDMSIGPSFTTANYLTIEGLGTASNGRAVISAPYGILASDYHFGDGTMHLVDASLFHNPSGVGTNLNVWGDGSALSYQFQAAGWTLLYNGISGNSLTGITDASPSQPTITAGTMVNTVPFNGKSLFASWALNPGVTFNNLELWGGSGNNQVGPVRGGGNGGGSSTIGSFTMTNCYMHDCEQGVGLNAGSPIGGGSFEHYFGCELYRCGVDGFTHNLYCGPFDELIFDGGYTHFTTGDHLLKSRARTSFITYSRITAERTTNTNSNDGAIVDVSFGGLVYMIGNAGESAYFTTNIAMQMNPEGVGTPAWMSASNPRQEIYAVNNTMIGPGTGAGLNQSQIAPFNIFYGGVVSPPISGGAITTSVAGSLSARTYFFQQTATYSGGETGANSVSSGTGSGSVGSGPILNVAGIAANSVAVVPSPPTITGATGYNQYVNYLDPVIYNPNYISTPTSNYWDAAHTQAIISYTAGGSLPVLSGALFCAFTYQFATGESALLGTYGLPFNTLAGGTLPWQDGTYSFSPTLNQTSFLNGAWASVPGANQLLVAASPPSVTGATGWNFYCCNLAYNQNGCFVNSTNLNMPLTKQNLSGPISIGTAFTEDSSRGLIQSAVLQPIMLRQNTSPIALGTAWTEASTGLANHNPTSGNLVWRRRIGATNNAGTYAGIDMWWTVAPSPLTAQTITLYLPKAHVIDAAVLAIKGALSTTWPFSLSNAAPVNGSASGTSISWAETDVIVVGGFRTVAGLGTAGSGYTQIVSNNNLMAEYQKFTAAGSTTLTNTNTGFNPNAVDAVVIGAAGGADGTATVHASGDNVTLTLTTTQSNDILILLVASDASDTEDCVLTVDSVTGPAPGLGTNQTTSTPISPTGVVQNNICANYSGSVGISADGGVVYYYGNDPTSIFANLTIANNFNCNAWNGSSFNAPLLSAVFADPVATDYDYRLKAASAPIGGGANPGSSPEGQSLVPAFQLELFGSPTPGTALPAKTVRPNTGGSFDQGAFEFGV